MTLLEPLDITFPLEMNVRKKAISLTPTAVVLCDMKLINRFYELHKREPVFDRKEIREYELSTKLQRLRHIKAGFPDLEMHDHFHLLEQESLSPFCKSKHRMRKRAKG